LYFADYPYSASGDLRGREPGGIDRRSEVSYPAVVFARDPQSNPFFPTNRQYTFAAPTQTPTTSDAVINDNDVYGRYDFNAVVPMLPRADNLGFYGRLVARNDDGLEWNLEVSYRQERTDVESAPTPVVSGREQGDAPGGGLEIPRQNPFNPFGQDITTFTYRAEEAGKRMNEVESITPRVVLALEKDAGDWKWESGLLLTENTTSTLSRNYLRTTPFRRP
jgi:hypothetical protein